MFLAFLVLSLLGIGAWMIYAARRVRRHLLFFQIEEYDNGRFAAFLWKNRSRLFTLPEVLVIGGLTVVSLLIWRLSPSATSRSAGFTVVAGLWIVAYVALFRLRKPPPSKKTLVLTARATRLLITARVLMLGTLVAAFWLRVGAQHSLDTSPGPLLALPAAMVIGLIVDHAVGLWLIAANGVMYPVEEAFRRYYVRSAQRIFRTRPGLKVVAVTGSYGKTSTKEIIAHILSARYAVLKTPRSFNTLMGICRVIREELRPEHEVFVVEMGAYKRGEIDRLCRLTPPHIGVLTAVGPQHLERFKTVDRVAEAKYELMQHLPVGGVGIFNGDDAWCRTLSERPAPYQVVRYGLESGDECSEAPFDIRAARIQVTGHGTEFDVTVNDGPSVRFTTALLGRHNVENILAAVAVALACGLALDEIAAAVRDVQPVEHRLERIVGAGGVLVIDDAYNSNPTGVRMALEVLAALPGGHKILVTPGMVELGDREEIEHRQMGRLAAKTCHHVILVGPTRTQAIAAGLAESAFPASQVTVVQSLKEASERLQRIVRAGDVVLFENDLPDTYDQEIVYF